MIDAGTLAVSILGLVAAVIFGLIESRISMGKEYDSDFKSKIQDAIKNKHGMEPVLKDYEITNKEIERRENITLLIGSILITGSVLILGNTLINNNAVPKFPYALTSILVFVLWLFVLHATTKKLDSMSYSRARAIEEALSDHFGYDFGVHKYLYSKTKKNCGTVWWLKWRKIFWGLILILLSSVWLLLSIIN
jgi:hypothetical protein